MYDSSDGGGVPWGGALGTSGAADRATARFSMVSGRVLVLVVPADTYLPMVEVFTKSTQI